MILGTLSNRCVGLVFILALSIITQNLNVKLSVKELLKDFAYTLADSNISLSSVDMGTSPSSFALTSRKYS